MSLEIDLLAMWRFLLAKKKVFLFLLFIFVATACFTGFSVKDKYKSSALLRPSMEGSSVGSSLSANFGGLASLAGLELPGGGENSDVALETIVSRSFAINLIVQNDLVASLAAAKSWKDGGFDYNRGVYDEQSRKFLKETQEYWELSAYKSYLKNLDVSRDKKTGLVRLSFESYSPSLPKKMISLIVESVNEALRERDKREAQANLDYLNAQLERTVVSEMKEVLFVLIEEQTKKLMLADVSVNYVFDYVDPPYDPLEKSSVSPWIAGLFCFLALFCLGVMSLVVAYLVNERC